MSAIHATAVALGEVGVLIRGRSGAGKSRLAAALLARQFENGQFGALIGDDRVFIEISGGRAIARGVPEMAGLLELRGLGIVALAPEPAVRLRLVVEFTDDGAAPPRMPGAADQRVAVEGVALRRLVVDSAACADDQARLALAAARLVTLPMDDANTG